MTEQAIDILFIAVDIVRAMLICQFLIRFTGAPNKPLYYLATALVFTMVNLLTIYAGLENIWSYILIFILLLALCLFFMKRTFVQSITGVLVVIVITSVLGNIFAAALMLASDALPFGTVYIINVVSIAASVIILWLLLRSIAGHFSFATDGRFPYMFTLWLPLLMIFVFSEAFAWATASTAVYVGPDGFGHMQTRLDIPGWWGLLVFLFALVCMIVLFYSYQKFKSLYSKREQALQLGQALRWQRAAMEEATLRYDNTKAFRHDLKNHLSVLSGLISEKRQAEAKDYLRKITGFAQSLLPEIQSGNLVVDVLLREKLAAAKQAGICITYRFDIGETAIDDYDLCILIGNALDNAIKACEEMPAGERFIHAEILRKKGFLYLEIENSAGGAIRKGQGYGLRNMRAVAEKYNGSMETKVRLDTFELSAILSIPLQK